jgi:predicted metal-dependent hydrolase
MLPVQIAFDFDSAPSETSRIASNVQMPPLPKSTRTRTLRPDAESAARIAPVAQLERHQLTAELETVLRSRAAAPLRLTVTDNRRTMISLRRRPRFMEVRLHHMFLYADQPTRDALADYLFDSDRVAAQQIGRFIEQHRERIRRHVPQPRSSLSTRGTHHDLAAVYRDVNQRYFDNAVDAHITWGRDAQVRRVRRSIKLGSYTARERLIRVHPALDAAYVPRFFIEYIVYHEMLHHVLPPKVTRGRRDLHGPTFQAREREFADYAQALHWERENLDRLLRRNVELRRTRRPAANAT